MAGVELVIHPLPWLSITPGIGVNLVSPQASLLTGVFLPGKGLGIGLQFGPSVGGVEQTNCDPFSCFFSGLLPHASKPLTFTWQHVWWWNMEVYVDINLKRRSTDAVGSIRPSVGLGIPLRASRPSCSTEGIEDDLCSDREIDAADVAPVILINASVLLW